ncbi:MAG TPA: peptidase M41 [Bacteroidetes bacterium]|jgi:ATP-dependent metalloprotease FtsH|nr:peptidase M41 [Bacteroidota bacterium]|tara:strand:- start:2000 stop:4075 length:2076 start_codon:yes stop_codon:yes gene_type:complete
MSEDKNKGKTPENQNGTPNPFDNKKAQTKKPKFNPIWIYAILAAIFLGITFLNPSGGLKKDTGEVLQMIKNGDVAKLNVVNRNRAEVYLTKEAKEKDTYKKDIRKPNFPGGEDIYTYYLSDIGPADKFQETIDAAQIDLKPEQRIVTNWIAESDPWASPILQMLLWVGILVLVWMFVMRRMSGSGGAGGGQLFSIGKSKAQLFDKDTKVNVTFKDVAGLEGAKEEVMEIVDFLKNPTKYSNLGGKIPKGALLVGPPGTGKTLLAKAVAGEADVPFFSLSGSDFVEMFVGVGASRVRDLFRQAKEKAPCIIFIDEIDAIGRARGKNAMQGGNDERENTLNQLLTEMDGFGTDSGVIMLAATNRVDILDSALLRAGRFDRQIYADMPDLNERRAIFLVHLKPIKAEENLDIDFLARQTPGFSGADIANMCNEAALIAARYDKKVVEKQDFLDAVDRIVGGLEKKNKVITPDEKHAVAVHEAGHATVSWLCEHAHPLVKVTIVPRGRSLGAAWYLPDERQITRTEQLLDEMCATLGGRAAEKVIFDKISTGALSDLEKVTKQAMAMVSIYGLNEAVGNVSYYNMDQSFSKPFSEKQAALMDDEIKKLTDEQYHRAIKIIADNKDKVLALANQLLDKEVIFKEDLEKIFGMSASDAIAKKLLDDQLLIADTADIIEETIKAVETEEIVETTEETS